MKNVYELDYSNETKYILGSYLIVYPYLRIHNCEIHNNA